MTRRVFRAGRWAVLGVLLAAPGAGCGGGEKSGAVSGKVTLRGRAPEIEGLTINFLGSDGQPTAAPVAADGTYRAAGVAEGTNRVGFSVPGPGLAGAGKPQHGKAAPKVQTPKSGPKDIPDRYLDPTGSSLTTVVTAGQENTFDVDIK